MLGQKLVFQNLDALSQHLQHGKVMIHHSIHQGIKQIIGSQAADSAMGAAQAASYRSKDIAIAFLQGNDIIFPQDKTDLLCGRGFIVAG